MHHKILSALSLVLILASCARNPVTGKREVMFMSEKKELAMGAQSDPQIVQSFGIYEDKKMQAFINKKGKEMGLKSHRPELKYEFKILDSPVVNAFALPGGYVYFTRGIMAHFNNEAEFAGVLGHEIGHVTGRHSAKQYTKQIVSQVALMAGMIVSPTFRQFSDVASQGVGLLMLKNSRDHESQSDKLGVIYSTAIGYDSHQMADFFQTLKRLSDDGSGSGIPTFLSTHPDPQDRYAKVHSYTDEYRAGKPNANYKVNRDSYLEMIDGLIYGDDPRQGFAENNVFYHPELQFQFPYPQGWSLNNTPSQVQIAPSDGKALMLFTLAGEASLEAAFAAQVQADQLQVLDKEGFKVNGFQALAGTFIQNTQNGGAIKILTYFIKKDKYIFKFHGMALQADFNAYENTFVRNFSQFNDLNDPAKLNVKPQRIKIATATKDATLQSTLTDLGASPKQLNELAILNGMELSDKITTGTKLKTITAISN